MIPTRIGQKQPGGRFAGIIQIDKIPYGIVVSDFTSPSNLPYRVSNSTLKTKSEINGLANTQAMRGDNYPAAQYCSTLVVDGCNDFYLPSKLEFKLCYRNLNLTLPYYTRTPKFAEHGTDIRNNTSSIPSGATFTSELQTIVVAFKEGNPLSFSSNRVYWTSTEAKCHSEYAIAYYFYNGELKLMRKDRVIPKVRAVRRIALL